MTGQQPGDKSYPANILLAIFLGEPQFPAEIGSHQIAIQNLDLQRGSCEQGAKVVA